MLNTPLEILYEGPSFVVINKPAGIATEKNFTNDTVEARAQVQWKRPGSSKEPFVGIVHRLDRPVSGALLLARNKSTLVVLNRAFEDQLVDKTYLALTEHPLPQAAGQLRHFIARDPTGRKAVASTRPVPGAKASVLNFRLLANEDGHYLYEITPVTGRFHQIRVQLSTAGAPIIGDVTYGSPRIHLPDAICLHAHLLTFPDPAGEKITVTAPLPDWA